MKKRTLKNQLRDELLKYAAELTNDRLTAVRRKEIGSALMTIGNRMRYIREYKPYNVPKL